MRKWIPAVPIAAGYALSFSIWPGLSDFVVPDWRVILPVSTLPSEPMPRAVFAFLFPTIALGLWIVLAAGARIKGRLFAEAIHRFSPTYTTIITCVVSLIVLLNALIVSTVVEWPSIVPHFLGATLGIGLMAVGNVMPRLRPNWIAGIRTAATVSDERLWLKTHRSYGMILVAHGAVVVCLAVAAPRYAFLATVFSLISAAAIAQLVTARPAVTS